MLIPSALAQVPGGGAGDAGLMSFLPIILMFVLLYFLMIRPQMKRSKEHKQMVDGLQKGIEVVTAGGVVGKITKVGEQFLTLEIAPNIEISVQRSSVQQELPKGTIKSLQ